MAKLSANLQRLLPTEKCNLPTGWLCLQTGHTVFADENALFADAPFAAAQQRLL